MAELTPPAGTGDAVGETGAGEALSEAVARAIARAVRGLRYGSVEIVVHDGAVVQIERKEKIRVGRDGSRSKG